MKRKIDWNTVGVTRMMAVDIYGRSVWKLFFCCLSEFYKKG